MKKYLQYKQKLVDLQKDTDLEAAHVRADAILLDILRDFGLEDIIEEYEKIDKWYA